MTAVYLYTCTKQCNDLSQIPTQHVFFLLVLLLILFLLLLLLLLLLLFLLLLLLFLLLLQVTFHLVLLLFHQTSHPDFRERFNWFSADSLLVSIQQIKNGEGSRESESVQATALFQLILFNFYYFVTNIPSLFRSLHRRGSILFLAGSITTAFSQYGRHQSSGNYHIGRTDKTQNIHQGGYPFGLLSL